MKHILNYLNDKLRIMPLGNLTTRPYEDTCGVYSGESVIIDGIDTEIVVSYVDYIRYLEENYEIHRKDQTNNDVQKVKKVLL